MKKKYQFKNKALQEALDAISGNDFSKKFDLLINVDDDDVWVECKICFGCVTPSGSSVFSISITRDDIEPYQGYDPDEWNDARYVVPPVGVWMLCEFDAADGMTHRYAAIYDHDDFGNEPCWTDSYGDMVFVDRFRAWPVEDNE